MGRLDGGQVGRGLARRAASPEGSLSGPRAAQIVDGPGAGHIEQPSLFCHGLRGAGVGDRNEALLEPGYEHDPPFEALRRGEM